MALGGNLGVISMYHTPPPPILRIYVYNVSNVAGNINCRENYFDEKYYIYDIYTILLLLFIIFLVYLFFFL